jgi:hypothetical protein
VANDGAEATGGARDGNDAAVEARVHGGHAAEAIASARPGRSRMGSSFVLSEV